MLSIKLSQCKPLIEFSFKEMIISTVKLETNMTLYSLGYRIPRLSKLEDILDFIEHLPLIDSPEAFGLHPNADITYQSNMAKDVLDTIMNIQPKDSAGNLEHQVKYVPVV